MLLFIGSLTPLRLTSFGTSPIVGEVFGVQCTTENCQTVTLESQTVKIDANETGNPVYGLV